MAQINQISLTIPEADLTEITASINTLRTKLLPYLKTLSPEERQELPKMGDKTVSFVQKTVEYCRQNSDLVPQFLDVNELAVDVKTVEAIRALYQPLLQITDSLSDTMTLAGSEAYMASLMFYSSAMHISVKVDTDFGFNWTGIPDQNGQLFRFKLDRSERSDELNF
jgi:hypothetical protein